MNQKLNELDPQVISDIANNLNIPAYVVEKDVHVTKVLNIISKIQDDTFHIVFHGGTCSECVRGFETKCLFEIREVH